MIMSKKSTHIQSLNDLFLHELNDIYKAEKDISKNLPKMLKAASSEELKKTLQEHLEENHQQINRLEQIFNNLQQKPGRAAACEGMKGIIKEGFSFLSMDTTNEVLDAALIGAVQRIEHYEIAVYGTLCTYASLLGQKENEGLLAQTLAEEKQSDQKLSQIAKDQINQKAAEVPSQGRMKKSAVDPYEEEQQFQHKGIK